MSYEPLGPPRVSPSAPSDGLVFSSWVTFDDYVKASRALQGRWSSGMTVACIALGTVAAVLVASSSIGATSN